jgi:hypothetical protein
MTSQTSSVSPWLLVAQGGGNKGDKLNLEACKQYCIEHNFQGFCALGEKAYFGVHTGTETEAISHELLRVEGAVSLFYVPNHNDGETTWIVYQDIFPCEDAHVKLPDAGLPAAELAAEEVTRRLSGLVDKLRIEFFDDFLGNHIEVPLYEALLQLMSAGPYGQDKDALRRQVEQERKSSDAAGGPHETRNSYFAEVSVDAAQLNQRLEKTKADFDRVVTSAMIEMKAFWMGELRAMLTAEVDICPADKTNKRLNSNDGLVPYYNVVTKWLSRVLPSFEEARPHGIRDFGYGSNSRFGACRQEVKSKISDLSLEMLRRKLVEHPPFQLSNYIEYTDVILTRMEEHFDKAAAGLIIHIERSLSSQITSFDLSTDWLEIRANKDDFIGKSNAMTKVRIKPHILFSHLRVIFARLTPTLEMLLSVTQGAPISGIGPAALARHRTLEAEIAELKKARDGLCAALDIPSEELDEIRRKMGDDIS